MPESALVPSLQVPALVFRSRDGLLALGQSWVLLSHRIPVRLVWGWRAMPSTRLSLLCRAWLAYSQGWRWPRVAEPVGAFDSGGVGLGRRASSNRLAFAPRPIGPEQRGKDSTPWVALERCE
ncbi:hypothetical protein VTN96DRAFT_10099 [Rasamsonia emersonii]